MIKILGSMLFGVFVGAIMAEVARRQRPELVDAIENKAKEVSDALFENMREAYDFRELEQVTPLQPKKA